MTKLKTLNDLQWKEISGELFVNLENTKIEREIYKDYYETVISIHLLRQEAIKQVKEYESDLKKWHESSKTYKYIIGQIQSLSDFFNITERDLK